MDRKDHSILKQFVDSMKKEWIANEHKGDFKEFKNIDQIENEIYYHIQKLRVAHGEDKKESMKEYIADSANLLLILGNAFGLYDEDVELKKLSHHEEYNLKMQVARIHNVKTTWIGDATVLVNGTHQKETQKIKLSKLFAWVEGRFKFRIIQKDRANIKNYRDLKTYVEENL